MTGMDAGTFILDAGTSTPHHATTATNTATMERLPLLKRDVRAGRNEALKSHLFLRQHLPDPIIPWDSA